MRRDLRAEGLLVFTTLIWGGTFAVLKGALADISPMLLVGIRFVLAAALAWPVLLGRRGSARPAAAVQEPRFTPAVWRWGLIIGVFMLAGYAGQTIGLKYTTVARSGFITFSFALYVPFLQILFLRQRPAVGNLIGLAVVLWGLTFITDLSAAPLTFGDLSPVRTFRVITGLMSGGMNIGDLYTLAGALGYAFYVVLLDRASRECHPGALTVAQMLFCGIFAAVLIPFTEVPFLVISWRLAAALFYLVAFGSVLALGLMNWFQRRLTPLRAVLIYALEPVFAAFIGWLAFREGISGRETAGALLILLGILVSDLWRYLPFQKTSRRPPSQC